MSHQSEIISAFHIRMLSNIILNYASSFEKLKNRIGQNPFDDKDISPLTTAMFCQTMIVTNSLLDEYDTHFNSKSKPSQDRIKAIKILLQPAIKRIKKWKEIKYFRDKYLAHNFRVGKNNVSVFENDFMRSKNIPSSYNEFQILIFCMQIISKNIYLFYDKDHIEIASTISTHIFRHSDTPISEKDVVKEIDALKESSKKAVQ